MKKTLIAAAVSIVAASSALAQSSVTVYGRVNVTAESLDRNGVKTKELVNNASRLDFKGTEDLGGGLKANFLLEHRFNVDTGTVGEFWAGDSYVGLSGGFGAVRLGRITSEAYYATADYISMNNHDTGTSADALYAYLGNNKNKIAYNTNSMGGLVLHAAIGAQESGPAGGKVLDLAATYELGNLSLGFGYEKNNASANQYAARALYTAGAFVFGGYVQRDKNGYGANVGNRTTFRLTGAYNVGSSEFHLGYGKAGDYSRVNDSDVTQLVLGYNYNLSKRTRLHTHYTKVSASRNTFYTSDLTALGVGVRHNF